MKLVKTHLKNQLSKTSLGNSIIMASESPNDGYDDELYEEFGNELTF